MHAKVIISTGNLAIINGNMDKIMSLCSKYKVDTLYVFGSILTNRFSHNSDIDFLVTFKTEDIQDYFCKFFDFKCEMESLFGREVDLVEEKYISNPYFLSSINQTKQLIYG